MINGALVLYKLRCMWQQYLQSRI